jgi:hypothetical protein
MGRSHAQIVATYAYDLHALTLERAGVAGAAAAAGDGDGRAAALPLKQQPGTGTVVRGTVAAHAHTLGGQQRQQLATEFKLYIIQGGRRQAGIVFGVRVKGQGSAASFKG